MPNFSHLGSQGNFPNVAGVDVYKYDNQFDYSRFNNIQMELQLCDVPWDVGEAHVGQRTISGIGNVVYFGSPEKRDAWFDAIPEAKPGEDPAGKCFRFETKFKELHREQIIDVPIPYNVAALFNYLVVRYQPFANKNSFVEYETGMGKMDWFWFVREVEFVAPNTTRLHLLDDAFQTWIYDVNIEGMILERGHAPMFETRAAQYLTNPLANNKGLLTDDVNYGSAEVVQHIDALALNSGNMWACIATSGDISTTWGLKEDNSWKVPSKPAYTNSGVPAYFVFAIEPSQLSAFLNTIQTTYPQFAQTVQGVFFAPKNLVNVSSTITFAGITCNVLTSTRKTLDLCELSKGIFGYDSAYADIAKLYTSPYAHIEITDENGNVDVIKIEDTTGNIDVSAAISLAYPFVNIEAHLQGVGGSGSASVTFRNINAQTFAIQGRWYETLRQWNVPTFAVMLSPAAQYDYSTHFDRAQAVTDYTATYNNTSASASTERSNARKSVTTERDNAKNSADVITKNAAIQVAANTAITKKSNETANTDTNYGNGLNQALQAWGAGYTRETVNNEVEAAYNSAAIGAVGGAMSSIASGAMSGGIAGAAGGLVQGVISGVTSGLQTQVTANLKTSQAEASISNSQSQLNEANQNNINRVTLQNGANSANTDTSNSAISGSAANTASAQKENADRTYNTAHDDTTGTIQATYDTAIANAGRERNRAQSAITNGINQGTLNAPSVFGSFSNGDSATTKPMALFANIVTQSKSAIAAAGDEFLRYGYMLDMQWPFNGEWNVGKYFTYWKLKDFWVRDLQVPDLYMDKLRFFLFGGVTIWRAPEYIGKVSVYDNFNG